MEASLRRVLVTRRDGLRGDLGRTHGRCPLLARLRRTLGLFRWRMRRWVPTFARLVVVAPTSTGANIFTVTRIANWPAREYACRPTTRKRPSPPMIVPRLTDPSPQRMTAAKLAAVVAVFASVRVATAPIKGTFLVGVMF